ncbi:MAG: hypothetical protein Unbinned6224contig1001_44 [Prokaryotic dsDNA virus sp.]|nr:MAG: hypothetical protein Unbinned6224contig1001_44 [Prokaryotic dsDNA virus sp.]|tara:strand:- start:12034 stop:12363 length:330 start_codon:yes stop_codon:yes gene_type:complete
MDTTTLIEAYGELGVIGCCMILFGFMITNLIKSQKHQDEELEAIRENSASMGEVIHNTQSIVLKLHDKIQRTGEQESDERNRRHESMMKEIDDLSDKISYLSGRVNGRS